MFAKKIAIDLGTVNTLVFVPGRGIVIREPSLVALDVNSNSVMAIGSEAEEMVGKTPETIQLNHPLRNGVIADFHITQFMLKHFINEAVGRLRLVKPDVMVSVPGGATSTERKAVIDATLAAGARSAYLIQEPVAAALGAQIPITSATGNMIVDIGGGTTEVAVIALGGVVAQSSARVGGNRLDSAIVEHLRHRHGISIGDRTAEEIKQAIGSAVQTKKVAEMSVKGRDIVDGLPKTITIRSPEITDTMQDVLERIVKSIRSVLEQTPPELVSDIIDQGIILSGGVAKLQNLDALLTKIIGVPVIVARDPMTTVAEGSGLALQNLADYQKSLLATT